MFALTLGDHKDRPYSHWYAHSVLDVMLMVEKEEHTNKGTEESVDHGCDLRRCPQCGYVVVDPMVARCPRCWGSVPGAGCDGCTGCSLHLSR